MQNPCVWLVTKHLKLQTQYVDLKGANKEALWRLMRRAWSHSRRIGYEFWSVEVSFITNGHLDVLGGLLGTFGDADKLNEGPFFVYT